MRRRSSLVGLAVLSALLLLATSAYSSVVVVYVDESGGLRGVMHPEASDPISAINALADPIPDPATGKQLYSAVLPGTRLLDLRVEDDTTIVDFSLEIVGDGLGEDRLATIFDQVRFTLRQFGLDGGVRLLCEGKRLSDYTPPTPVIAPRPGPLSTPGIGTEGTILTGSLSGRSVTVSPGHGIYWNGSYWTTQRPVYCSPLNQEDFHNLEMCQYLERYLLNDGATVKMVRCTDKNYGNHYTGNAWWKMGACYWLEHVGYPCSVYGPYGCNLGSGGSDGSNDIASRPLSSDYDNTNIYVSLHTNGYTGDCYGGCPSGTETYYDASAEHAPWATVSLNLANNINSSIMSAINTHYDPGWQCHGVCVKNSNGAYGEIRIPDRAATLTELAFHDSCSLDAVYLRDNFFRSAAMWGMYKGICSYFGATPTWGFYSCEYVSDTIPTVMETGHQYVVSITYRNKGVLWTEAKQIRLGAVGDSDPFTTQTRHYITGEVGTDQTYTFTFTMTAPNCGGTYLTDWQMVRDGYTWFGPIVSRTLQIEGPPDMDPPSVPANVVAEGLSTTEVGLSWSPSTDNVGVTGYRVFRNGSPLGTTTQTSYLDTGLTANTMYTYTVTAYDAVANESAQSDPAYAITHVVVFQDGFPDLNAWTPDVVANGTVRGLDYYEWEGHNTYPGDGSVVTVTGSGDTQGSFSYRPLPEPFNCGAFNCWFFDQVSGPCRQGIHARGFNGSTLAFSAFMGPYPNSPGTQDKYSAAIFDGSSWTWATQIQVRSISWQDFRIVFGPTEVRYYINGVKKATLPRPANVNSFGLSRVNIGHEYNVNFEGWYDDAQFTAPPPLPPTIGTPVALSTSSIRWNFTDRSNNESSFRLHDAGHTQKGTAVRNSSYIDETALSPNTQYTRHIHGRNGTVEGPASASASRYTLSVPPTTSTVTCDKAASTWYATPDFTFTAVGGFGPGTVQYYRYAWDQNNSHSWTGTEQQWSSGDLALSASSAGSWYLHVKGYNGDDVENGTLTLGPYLYAETVSTIPEAKGLADSLPVALSDKIVTANFGTFLYIEETDGTSGIRVECAGPGVRTLVTVAGVMQTVDGERRITDATAEGSVLGTMPGAPLIPSRYVGGASLNSYTPGVFGGVGVNNIGLLITAVGKITHAETGFMYIDDGRARQDGSGFTGIRVNTTGLTGPFNDTKYAVVKGISSTHVVSSNFVPLLRPRDDADVLTYQLP